MPFEPARALPPGSPGASPYSPNVAFDLVVMVCSAAALFGVPSQPTILFGEGTVTKIVLKEACPACGDDREVLLTRFHPEFPGVEEARVRCRNGACGYTAWRQLDPSYRQTKQPEVGESTAPAAGRSGKGVKP